MSAPMAITLDAREDWMAAAEHAILSLANRYSETGRTFTADDLHEVELLADPDDSRWPGTAFRAARSRGEIVKTGDYVPSRRRSRKGSILAVWRAA